MAWTYSGDPSSSNKDEVRFLIGDTNAQDPLIQDEEIQYALSKQSSIKGAAAVCCKAIAAKFAREADAAIGKAREQSSQKYEHYLKLEEQYRREAARYGEPIADIDPDGYTFFKGIMDHPDVNSISDDSDDTTKDTVS